MPEEAKPFIKWAGGKYKLSDTIIDETKFNIDFKEKDTYIDPFVGGGGMFFSITNRYKFKRKIISDINKELINTYIVVRDNLESLIKKLSSIEEKYNSFNDNDKKKEYYYKLRSDYNNNIINDIQNTTQAALFIALNKLGFNGLYRVNKKGLFNVPSGQKKIASLFDLKALTIASKRLSDTEIYNLDYKDCIKFVDENSVVYFDSPYRPLPNSPSFTSYSKSDFNDDDQIELAKTAKDVTKFDGRFFLSNSDPTQVDKEDTFFDELYSDYIIKRINAKRMIGAKSSSRGTVSEILVIG